MMTVPVGSVGRAMPRSWFRIAVNIDTLKGPFTGGGHLASDDAKQPWAALAVKSRRLYFAINSATRFIYVFSTKLFHVVLKQ